MRRALAALVVTVVAVVLLARFETQPPVTLREETLKRPASTPRAVEPGPRCTGPGSADGPAMTTPFSVIQVRATVRGRRLACVETVALSGDGPYTDALNARAEPILREAALRAGSADVDVVSGATSTSRIWMDSLRGAIREARRVERVMGMAVGIVVRDRVVDLEPAFAWLRWVDAAFSPYRPDSEVSRLGRGEAFAPHTRVAEVLDRCDALRAETGGWFDARASGRLDPSGLVKGWAVDGAAALLEAAGARDFCVNAGGDLRVRGAWRVGIQHPRAPGGLAAVLELRDAAVATSGAYERGAHVLDPHTGRPPEGVLSVTIAGPDLATADAYATAAFAMGRGGPAWTAERGLAAMTVLDSDRVLTTAGLRRAASRRRAPSPAWGR